MPLFKWSKKNTTKDLIINPEEQSIRDQIDHYIKTRLYNEKNNKLIYYNGDLIVDDISSNRFILNKFLKYYSINSEEVTNGLEALQKISTHNYRNIWMDIKMPIMDGLEATKYIKNDCHYKHMICAITAYTDIDTDKLCLESGIDIIVNKPISLKMIEEINKKIDEKSV